MSFMVSRQQASGAVKDVAGIEYLCADGVGYGATDDVDLVASGDVGQYFTGPLTIGIGIVQDRFRVEAQMPKFRQEQHIRPLLHGFHDHPVQGGNIPLWFTEDDIHL